MTKDNETAPKAVRSFTGFFCEDVRFEMGNRFTLIGCITQPLLIPKEAGLTPRLAVLGHFTTKQSEAPKSLTIRLLRNGTEEVMRHTYPESEIAMLHSKTEGSTDNECMTLVRMYMEPHKLEGNAVYCLVATTEDGDIRGPQIRIQAVTVVAAEPANTPAPEFLH